MFRVGAQPEGVDWDKFNKTASNIETLKSRLTDEAALALASEVLNRVNLRFLSQKSRVKQQPLVQDIEALATALIAESPDEGQLFVSRLYDSGVKIEDIYVGYLAAAAQKLGEWWDDDRVSFVDVRIGATRIYAILQTLDQMVIPKHLVDQRSAMFASIPDELHTLGVSMACDLFKQKGWDVDLFIGLTHDELIAEIDHTKLPIICLSSGGSHSIDILAKLVLAIRIHRPDLYIFVSGKIVEEVEDLLQIIEPDGVASDIDTALEVMESFYAKA